MECLLQAAPQLKILQIPLESCCAEADFGRIGALCRHLAAGLRISALYLTNMESIEETLAIAAPLLAITDLILWELLPRKSISQLQLVRVFPSLVYLRVCKSCITDRNASVLLGLVLLEVLEMTGCKDFTDVGALTCMRLPVLRRLHLQSCDGVSDTSVLQAQARIGIEVIHFGIWHF